ncbi:hypothetical protein AB0J80_03285 [Actinoplanes sp. NPDC049548]|uniref:hypothetical protein n=1 Tax=Actinoplanes sp. NPDC049548 TaxID=3155152 RepID=UPI0034317914
MSDMSRDQGTDADWADPADEPTTGAPAGAVAAAEFDPGRATVPSRPGSGRSTTTGRTPPTSFGGASASAPDGTTPIRGDATPNLGGTTPNPDGSTPDSGGTEATAGGAPPGTSGGRTWTARLTPAGPAGTARKRRRRRWLIAGFSAGALLVLIGLCAGGLAVLSAFSGARDDAADAREDHRVRDTACLELEQRLNRLTPPGATTTPQTRAAAVRNENAAVRIYVNELRDGRTGDGWRQLLDARTAYAEALEAQVKSRTPAFFVAPRTGDGRAVTDELDRFSPAACAGPIRRLAAPDL